MKLLPTERALWRRAVVAIVLLSALPAVAETQLIQLSSEDEQRLGIRFDQVSTSAASDGFPVPALVINSPEQRSQLTTFFNGNLTGWFTQGGETVQRGQLVASINSPTLMLLQEQWLAAQNHRLDMEQQLSKDQQLLADGIISKQRLKQTQRAHSQALFSLQARRQQLYQAGISDQDLKALKSGEEMPGEYQLRAPRAGVVSQQPLAVGDAVNAGQSLATVTDASSLWLRAQLPLPLAQLLQPGNPLSIANSDATLTLISKNAALSPTTQQVGILARFDQPNTFYPGQQLALIIPAARPGYLIPAAAVTHNGMDTIVYVKVTGGVEARTLELIPLGEAYLATTNINSNEQLVIQGSAQLKGMQLGLGGNE